MNIENWLNEVRVLDQKINEKLAERDRLVELATNISPSPMDGMPFSNTGVVSKQVENTVVELVALAGEINKLIDQYVDHKQQVIKALEKLTRKEYAVLHRYYIQGMTWEQVAEDLGYCSSQVWRIKKKGLENLENAVECNTEM